MKRHVGTVMRPTRAQNSRGGEQGQPQTILRDVPCSIETLSGREGERARQILAAASHVVRLYGDPTKPLRATDWIEVGKRRLNIGHVNDRRQNGVELELLCEEVVE